MCKRVITIIFSFILLVQIPWIIGVSRAESQLTGSNDIGNQDNISYEDMHYKMSSKLFAGGEHTLIVINGEIWAWGKNTHGQLGNGTTTDSAVPVKVTGLSDVIAVASKGEHSLALKKDGSVWAWGYNLNGQLGDQSVTQRTTPVKVIQYGIISIDAGFSHSVALDDHGAVWEWGVKQQSFAYVGTPPRNPTPRKVLDGAIIAIASGKSHTIALSYYGTIETWGSNSMGELGNGTTSERVAPGPIKRIDNVVAITAGDGFSEALTSNGKVWTWGLKIGESANSINKILYPTEVEGLDDIVTIAAGNRFSLALKNEGSILARGSNEFAQLGNGLTIDSSLPVQITGLTNIRTIGAATNHSFAIKEDGSVWMWGSNENGRIKNSNSFVPTVISGLTNVSYIAAGKNFSLATKGDGTVWGWGENTYGQLGNGSQINSKSPVRVQYSVIGGALAAGEKHSLGMFGSNAKGWGSNSESQITASGLTPVSVRGILSSVVSIAAGSKHSLALDSDGYIWGWGLSTSGQVGVGSYATQNIARKLTTLNEVTLIKAGGIHSLAAKKDGTAWAWGGNNDGQLGLGNTTNTTIPTKIDGLTDVVALAAGGKHSLAVKKDGTVWAWGLNSVGQLGVGTVAGSSIPIQVTGLSDAVAVVAGENHSVAILADGTVWAWGLNSDGQLGIGNTNNALFPVKVPELTNVIVSAGYNHTLAVSENGTIWSWGNNDYGQLGNGLDLIGIPIQISNVTITDVIKPTQPSNFRGDLSRNNEVGLSWERSMDNTEIMGYEVYEGSVIVCYTIAKQCLITGLSDYTNYSFTVKSVDIFGNRSDSSEVVNIKSKDGTPPSAPGNLTATMDITTNSVSLSWTESIDDFGFGGYKVYQSDNSSGNQSPFQLIFSTTDCNYTVIGLKSGIKYKYMIIASDLSGNGSSSEEIEIEFPSHLNPPNGLSGSFHNYEGIPPKPKEIYISWNESTTNEIVSYDIYLSGFFVLNTTDNFIALYGPAHEGVNRYTVVARDALGNASPHSEEVTINVDKTRPNAPTNLQVNLEKNLVRLSWTESTDNFGIFAYKVMVDSVTYPCDITNCLLLVSSGRHEFSVFAIDYAGNVSEISEKIIMELNLDVTPPSLPSNIQATWMSDGIKLDWSESIDDVGIDHYEVEVDGNFIGTSLTNSFIISEIETRPYYYVVIIAIDTAGLRSKSNSAFISPDKEVPTIPRNLQVISRGKTTAYVSWTEATDDIGVVYYRVALNGSLYTTTTDNHVEISGLVDGNRYYVSVYAVDGVYNISLGNTFNFTHDGTPPNAPPNLRIFNGGATNVYLKWDRLDTTEIVDYVSSYDIYVNSVFFKNTNENGHLITGLEEGVTYHIEVVAKDIMGNVSTPSSIYVTTDGVAPSSPKNIKVLNVGKTFINLGWDASTDNVGVVAYDLLIYESFLYETSPNYIFKRSYSNYYEVTDLKEGTFYDIYIQAVDAMGNRSDYAVQRLVSTSRTDVYPPHAPNMLFAEKVGATNIVLNWADPEDYEGVVEFDVYDGETFIGSSITTRYPIDSLLPDKIYSFNVRAKDAAGNISNKSSDLIMITSNSAQYYYDLIGRLDYIKLSTGQIIDYQYDDNGNQTTIILP